MNTPAPPPGMYEGQIWRPPSEAKSFVLQATVGCSWNHCTYCDMYRDKAFRVKTLAQIFAELAYGSVVYGQELQKVFVGDGDALAMDMEMWDGVLSMARHAFPKVRQISCYATAHNIMAKSDADLKTLADGGLRLLYIGPESGDDVTLKRIAKGADFAGHAEASRRAKAAGMKVSAIFLLGAGGTERSEIHARASARLVTAMDPDYLAALTLTVVPGTPLEKLQQSGRFVLPDVKGFLRELRWFIAESDPTDALFRTNHASNYLPIGGRLPRDRAFMLEIIDRALAGDIQLRDHGARGL